LTVYSAAAFDRRWMQAAFCCFCWILQPVFTLLAIYMWKKEVGFWDGKILKFRRKIATIKFFKA
jgi:hypothetical protein